MFCISMLASVTGVNILRRVIEKYNRHSIVAFLLLVVVVMSTVLLPVFVLSQMDFSQIGFSNVC